MNDIIKSIAVAAVVVTIAALVLKSAAAKTVESVTEAVENVNEGTPFAGTGPIGTFGNLTDVILFRLPSKLGGAIGRGLFTLFNPGAGEG